MFNHTDFIKDKTASKLQEKRIKVNYFMTLFSSVKRSLSILGICFALPWDKHNIIRQFSTI